MPGAVTVRTVKYFLLLAFAILAGCADSRTGKEMVPGRDGRQYTRLTVTDVTGDLISVWTAEGVVKKNEQGYTIRAVERRTPKPYGTDSKYPNGRISTVVGPNIILEDVEKPGWLRRLDENP